MKTSEVILLVPTTSLCNVLYLPLVVQRRGPAGVTCQVTPGARRRDSYVTPQVLEVVREQLAAEAAGSAVASEASARVAEQLAEQVAALKGQVVALQAGNPEADFIKQVIE